MPTRRVFFGLSALIQTTGRPRHVEGVALLCRQHDRLMAKAISETELRRAIQQNNEKNGVPTAAGRRPHSILSFLELSRKLKQDGPDADLVEVGARPGPWRMIPMRAWLSRHARVDRSA